MIFELSEAKEDKVFELLKNKRDAVVSFIAIEEVMSYNAYWLKNWAFKVSYFKDFKKVYIEIAPLLIEKYTEEISDVEKQNYVPILKQKTEDIAKSLLRDDEILFDNGVFVKMAEEYLNAKFDYGINKRETLRPIKSIIKNQNN